MEKVTLITKPDVRPKVAFCNAVDASGKEIHLVVFASNTDAYKHFISSDVKSVLMIKMHVEQNGKFTNHVIDSIASESDVVEDADYQRFCLLQSIAYDSDSHSLKYKHKWSAEDADWYASYVEKETLAWNKICNAIQH